MADRFYVGQGVRASLEFKNSANALVDPSIPKVSVKRPDGTNSVYTYPSSSELVKDSTGKYHIDIDVTLGGDWYIKGVGTGGITVATEIAFRGVATNAT